MFNQPGENYFDSCRRVVPSLSDLTNNWQIVFNISKQSWRWKAVRNFFGIRQTIMHAFKQEFPTRPKSHLAMQTPAKIIRRPKARSSGIGSGH